MNSMEEEATQLELEALRKILRQPKESLSGKLDLEAFRSLSRALVFWICVMSEAEEGCLCEGRFLSSFLENGR